VAITAQQDALASVVGPENQRYLSKIAASGARISGVREGKHHCPHPARAE
jgi:hypothetical protein